MKKGKLVFGFSVVQNGQKTATVNAEPRLIANSTSGKFTITAPVSKALNVAPGDYVMFLNTIAETEEAIATRNEVIVEWANENGIDLDTLEGREAALKEFVVWGIAKGYPLYNAKGEPIMAKERYSNADKEKFLAENAEAMLPEMREMLIERVGNADASDDELLAALTIDDIEVPTFHACSGSKTSTSSSTATGVGCQLGFTDTSIWTTLKADMEDKGKQNRVFTVDTKEPYVVQLKDGFNTIDVTVYPIEFEADEDIIVREKKA